uniref:Uncharacterized protein n=1 Tax=Picea glauca TaxID=3330 RepID=A0A101LUW6_PICGL|nr:hypothetical protein ABT39_MTgene2168 [Picea glauca]
MILSGSMFSLGVVLLWEYSCRYPILPRRHRWVGSTSAL